MYWGAYIACDIPTNVSVRLIDEAKNKLGELSKFIAWHEPTYLHMTLHFLGWILDDKVDEIKNQINFKIDLETTPFISSLGWNEEEKYLVLNVKKDNQLIKTYDLIESNLKEKCVFVKRQEFIPHISLGRIFPDKNSCFNDVVLTNIKIEKINELEISLFESVSKSIVL